MSKKAGKSKKKVAVLLVVLVTIIIALAFALGSVTNWYRDWSQRTGNAEEPKTEEPSNTDEPGDTEEPTKEKPNDTEDPKTEDPGNTDEPKTDDSEKQKVTVGELVVTEGTKGEGISLLISEDETEEGQGTVLIQVITPDYEGEITLNAAYTGEEVFWAGDSPKQVEDCIALTQIDSRTVRIAKTNAFGTQIAITATRTDTEETATALCDYMQTYSVTDLAIGINKFAPNGAFLGAKVSDPVRLTISPDKAQTAEYSMKVASNSYTIATKEVNYDQTPSFHFEVDETWLETFFPDDVEKSAFMEYSAEVTGDGELADFFDTAWGQYSLEQLYPEQTLSWWFDFLWNKTVESESGGTAVSIYIDSLPAYVLTVSWGETSYTYQCSFDLAELEEFLNE